MKYIYILSLFIWLVNCTQTLVAQTTTTQQNFTKEQTVKYIKDKMKIADPVYNDFVLGENGELLIKWVNNGFYTEYRLNIREVEFDLKVSETGDNYIVLTCISGVNNCLQNSSRQAISLVGDKVNYSYSKTLNIESIAGFDNISSLNNALKYLKILSIQDNADRKSERRDPFLY